LTQFAGWNMRFCTVAEYGLGGDTSVASQSMVEMYLEPAPAGCPMVYAESMRTLLQVRLYSNRSMTGCPLCSVFHYVHVRVAAHLFASLSVPGVL